jgi:hypothetical protein
MVICGGACMKELSVKKLIKLSITIEWKVPIHQFLSIAKEWKAPIYQLSSIAIEWKPPICQLHIINKNRIETSNLTSIIIYCNKNLKIR